VAASRGSEQVLFQRAKKSESLCFPFDSDGTATSYNVAPGYIINVRAGSRTTWTIPTTTPRARWIRYPCWPYNEKLYANKITYGNAAGSGYYCHDGSETVLRRVSAPRRVAGQPAAVGHIGWKDMDPSKTVPLPDRASSSGQRFTTGFFTTLQRRLQQRRKDGAAGRHRNACIAPPCQQHVPALSLVSIGEVDMGRKRSVRRAVKVDIAPSALYTGVIDKYVDLTMMYTTDINGPVHINGWWGQQQISRVSADAVGVARAAPDDFRPARDGERQLSGRPGQPGLAAAVSGSAGRLPGCTCRCG